MPARTCLAGSSLVLLALVGAGCSDRQRQVRRFKLESIARPATPAVAAGQAGKHKPAEYVGSESCRKCHGAIFEAWQTTRHSYSIMTAEQARRAGYPLPKPARENGAAVSIRSWEEVSEVVGGRKRIAYADRDGIVAPSAFQHRTGGWSVFPSKPMDCRPCHYTGSAPSGANSTPSQTSYGPARYAELNIGCEACHGPGSRHIKTYRKEDIRVDFSTRVCGECHTAVNRILPKEELHETHDLVQTWNQDPHVTGVRFLSHNTACARCHSPQDSHAPLEAASTGLAVFSENRRNITCTGCHNPHRLTNAAYTQEKVRLTRPLPAPSHVLNAPDRDISTDDFLAFESADETCTHCHSGADRIDLDHGNASCSDCHNTFQYNRGPASASTAPPDHRHLSCRQCHAADGDHLLQVATRDPDFLSARYLHNLRTLPQAAARKYARRYAGLPAITFATGKRQTDPPHKAQRTRAVAVRARVPPQKVLARAVAGIERGQFKDLEHAMSQDPVWLVETVPFLPGTARLADIFKGQVPDEATIERIQAVRPDLADGVKGCVALLGARFNDAEAAWSKLSDARSQFGLAVAQLGQSRLDDAEKKFLDLLEAPGLHAASRLGLAIVHLQRHKFTDALDRLEAVLESDPANVAAFYAMGLGHLRQQRPDLAIPALEQAVRLAPERLALYHVLSAAYRQAGATNLAANALAEVVKRQPNSFEAHVGLANTYKLLMDSAYFEAEGMETAGQSRDRAEMQRRGRMFAEQALAEFAVALRLRPSESAVMRQVGEIYRRLGRLDEAREVFSYLAQRQPREWVLWYRLGAISMATGDAQRAAGEFRHAVSLSPTSADAHAALGLAYTRLGQTRSAIRSLEAAVALQPFHPGIFINLGACQAANGDLAAARKSLSRSIALGTFPLPKLYLAHTNLALAAWREGDTASAIQSARHALHIRPDFQPAQLQLSELEKGHRKPAPSSRYVFYDLIEIFGEITTAEFQNE